MIAIDLHLVHEVTSPQAFDGLRARGLRVRRPGQTVATLDHSIPTTDRSLPIVDEIAARQVARMEENARDFGIPLHGIGSPHQGIVHVIGPELGLTQPGMTIVCGDSHTATHGAFGALAFGIGTTEVEHVLATQALLQRRRKTFEVRVDGRLHPGVTAKDIILALLGRIGIGGATGHVFEYRGSAIRAIGMEGRMTICNMSIEGGPCRTGRAGRHHVRVRRRAAVRAQRRRLGRGRRDLAHAANRRRRRIRSVDRPRRVRARADGHVRDEPRHGLRRSLTASRTPMPSPIRPSATRSARLAYMALAPGRADPGPTDRRGVRRLVHELPDQRPARGGAPDPRTARRRRRADDGRAGSTEVKRQAEAEGLA